ncbi:MAG: ABC transporter ATP-binding protein [Candidatus Palauibacterales bacterium]|nr:ABC transporter ATP-binding protein [Candidatus Palauibacterales bacterium]
MSDLAVRVEHLGKEYHIGAVQTERYRTLRDQVARSVAAPFRRASKLLRGQATGAAELDETIWALRDVSFDVPRGQVLGIIGHNGAGKSTLLKILSRITEPSEGFVEIHGRVGCLLEVGTGFHPELTGRENVYLNGAILGMTRARINEAFDEIVEFSGVEKFIDTPVKHYSSGMGLRLAFAVAAHLDPEILIVDEVLAVGDAAFQQKCLGKMGEVAEAGRTVLLVSHNMSAITRLCERAILLANGEMVASGDPEAVISTYLGESTLDSSWNQTEDEAAPRGRESVFQSIRVLDGRSQSTALVPFDEGFQVEVTYELPRPVRDLVIVVAVFNHRGEVVCVTWDTDSTDLAGKVREAGLHTSTCRFPSSFLKPGRYLISTVAHIPKVQILERRLQAVAFEVSPVGYPFEVTREGLVTPMLQWTVDSSRAQADALPR